MTYLGIINKNPDIALDRTRIGREPRYVLLDVLHRVVLLVHSVSLI